MASALTAAVNKNVSFSPGRYHRASYQISYSLICSKIRLINNNLLPNRRNLYLFMWHSGTLNLLQGPICCSIRNAFLHTLIVTGTYLTYCCLPVRSNYRSLAMWLVDYIFVLTSRWTDIKVPPFPYRILRILLQSLFFVLSSSLLSFKAFCRIVRSRKIIRCFKWANTLSQYYLAAWN